MTTDLAQISGETFDDDFSGSLPDYINDLLLANPKGQFVEIIDARGFFAAGCSGMLARWHYCQKAAPAEGLGTLWMAGFVAAKVRV